VSAYQFTAKWDTENLDYIGKDNVSAAGGIRRTSNKKWNTDHLVGSQPREECKPSRRQHTLHPEIPEEDSGIECSIELNSTTPSRVFDGSLKKLNFVTRQEAETPSAFAMSVYPNPFTMSSPLNIKLRLPEAGSVGVEIITVSGMKVKAILANCDAGINTLVWDGKDDGGNEVKSGLYL